MCAHKRCEDREVVLEMFALLSACHLVFAVADAAHERFLSSTHAFFLRWVFTTKCVFVFFFQKINILRTYVVWFVFVYKSSVRLF